MNYNTLTNQEKGLLCPLIQHYIGIYKDTNFSLTVNGTLRFFKCKKVEVDWPTESMGIVFNEPSGPKPKLLWRISLPLFTDMIEEIKTLPIAVIRVKSADGTKSTPPPKLPLPKDHASLREWVSSLEAGHFFTPKELAASGDVLNDAVLRVLGKVAGTLEVMEKRMECRKCTRDLVAVEEGEYNVPNIESNSSKR